MPFLALLLVIKVLVIMLSIIQLVENLVVVSVVVENDITLQIYTDKGEVAQLSYASLRIKKSNPTVAFIDLENNISCMISFSQPTSSSSLSLKKAKRIDYHPDLRCAVLATGYVPDCVYITKEYFSFSQNHRLVFAEAPSLDALSSHLSSWMTRGLYRNNNNDEENSRPPLTRSLAASILLTKFDEKLQKVRLACVDHTGFVADYQHYMAGSISPANIINIKNCISTSPSPSSLSSSNWRRGEQDESCIQRFICKVVDVLNFLENNVDLNSNSCCDCEITLLNEHGAVRSGYEGTLEDKREEIARLVNGLRYGKVVASSPPY
eukprot:gene31036-40373_t